MKHIRTIIAAAIAVAAAMPAVAQQPLGGCWHPDDIRNWSPQSDPDARFNRSRIPLATRFREPATMRANASQHYEGEICDATILSPMCSSTPSQGGYNFLGYQLTYWQYIDKLVYWAGSASEGIIIPPPAGYTDAAHAQGVKSLGQIFFPPKAFGGKKEWVDEMLTVENGEYIFARKCYEIAKYMGFDGWFINEETGYDADAWALWIKAYMDIAEADGNPGQEIQWYNASRRPSTAVLKTHKNTSQFLEYGAVGDYRSYASQIGCKEAETFSKIYAGVQVAQSGHTGFRSLLRKAMPASGHVGSLDLFCPEERTWKALTGSLLNTADACGEAAYDAITRSFGNEEDMWVNFSGDPSATPASGWPGISGAVVERSAITSLPFVSTMSTGVGKHRFIEGEIRGTRDWHHAGMQSVLPTWRWWIENRGTLTVAPDWDEAWNSASSFRISGTLSAGDHLTRLYKTQIPVEGAAKMKVVYKTDAPVRLEGCFSTASSVEPDVTVQPTVTAVNGWKVAEYDLTPLSGKTLYMVALNLRAEAEVADFSLNLGEVSLLPAGYSPAPVSVSNFSTESVLGDERGDLRLTWDWEYTPDFDHFNIYTVTSDGRRTLVGQTRDEAFYIPSFPRNGLDESVRVELIPVMKDMREYAPMVLTVDYPAPAPPKVTLSMSRNYVKVGETVELTARGTGAPTGFEWTLSDGLRLAEGYTAASNPVRVEATAVGEQSVSVSTTNEVGTSQTDFRAVDVLSDADFSTVMNVVKGKTVVDYSGSTNSKEVPDKIIDGVTNPSSTADKWCNVSPDNWVIFDLERSCRVYGFGMYDGNYGPESGVEQIHSYEIELSADGQTWTRVLAEEGVENETVKTAYIVPSEARYVKLTAHVNGTLRIWEFEVYGSEALSGVTAPAVEDAREVKGFYNLQGQRITRPSEGVFIIRYSDGTAEKVIK